MDNKTQEFDENEAFDEMLQELDLSVKSADCATPNSDASPVASEIRVIRQLSSFAWSEIQQMLDAGTEEYRSEFKDQITQHWILEQQRKLISDNAKRLEHHEKVILDNANRLIENQQRAEETKTMLIATSRFDHRNAFFVQFAEIEAVERMHEKTPKNILKEQGVLNAGVEALFALRKMEEEMGETLSELEWIDDQSQDGGAIFPHISKCEDQCCKDCVAAQETLNTEASDFSSDSDGAGVLLPFITKRKERAAARPKTEQEIANPFSDSNRILSLASDPSSDSSGSGFMLTPGPVSKTVHWEETD
jgi:hypothetical protein